MPAFEFLSMPHVYNVKAGDTLDSIAHEHGISLATLVARNKITECVPNGTTRHSTPVGC